MKKRYLSLLYLGTLLNLSAQEVLWQKDIASSTQNILSDMTFTPDRQMVLSGSSIHQNSENENNGYDYHVVKLLQDGEISWEKYFGGAKNDYLHSVVSTNEGGLILAGTSFSNQSHDKKEKNAGGSDVWILRLDESGEELWQKTIGTQNNEEASSIIQSTDQGFFLAGSIQSNNHFFGSKDIFVSKLNEQGKLIKTIILGGDTIDEVTDMIATPDGGAAILIYSTSMKSADIVLDVDNLNRNDGNEFISSIENLRGKSQDSFGEGDYWVVKLDENANIEWQKIYGGEKDDYPKSIVFTETGYLIGGESKSGSSGNKKEDAVDGTDLWLISLDHSGNEIWQKNYSLGGKDILMSMHVIRTTNQDNQSLDKGYLLGGYTQAEERVRKNDEQFWMLYLDSKGNEEWRKHTEGKSAKKEEHLVTAKLQNDGTYILAGTSGDITGDENWKILKLGDKQLSELVEKYDIRIYPNPANEYCYVELGFELEKNEEAEIFLHDMSGRKIQTLNTKNAVTKVDTKVLPAGVYIVTVKTSNKTVNSKLVKK
ncbi:T9SS type A sorting domain-containing protein [Moheibacter sediminis]|uniref:Por secretion system C-terminal sorting domain-containing protein n=1 Tax=Moheibacter sediminis TaxID=1434700 RepID=A0A1W2BC46_9FLAO|nr:T9SS type A sorting domain-containing protein [Moheibacter sediminis]SMC70350.1 Por secretion system C-terminal sorting domain-containing protein [Moheibacter sediminis]